MEESKKEEIINFGKYLERSKRYWWVLLIGVVCGLGMSLLYMKVKSPLFLTKTLVMVNQDEEESAGAVGGLGALMSSFSIGGGTGSNVEDEMMKMGSHSNMIAVVKQLRLNRNYWSKDGLLERKIWYYNDSPVEIEISDAILDTISVSTKFSIFFSKNSDEIRIKIKQGDAGTIYDATVDKLPHTVKTPYGSFKITATEFFKKGENLNFYAIVCNPDVAIEDINERMAISQLSKKANAIQLDLEDVNVKRAKDFLNTLIASYNERGLITKNEQALYTAKFIDERLLQLYGELEDSEVKIENYKRENQIVDATAEAEYIFKKKETMETSMVELETKVAVLQMIKDFLTSPENKYNLVPFTADFPEEPISAYNELVLQLINLETNAKKNNATLKNLTAQIDAMRHNVITTIDKQLQSTRIALADLGSEASSSKNRMEGIPRMERELTALYRDQVIKNEIYGYLLQKREENQLKLMRNTPKGKVIDMAYSEIKPISPNKIVVPALGLIFGFGMGLWATAALDRRRIRKLENNENENI